MEQKIGLVRAVKLELLRRAQKHVFHAERLSKAAYVFGDLVFNGFDQDVFDSVRDVLPKPDEALAYLQKHGLSMSPQEIADANRPAPEGWRELERLFGQDAINRITKGEAK